MSSAFQAEQQPLGFVTFNHNDERLVPSSQVSQGPWTPFGGGSPPATATTGCDSSSCSYCHSMIARRRIQGENGICWLRRKRSENELASMATNTSPMATTTSPDALLVPDVDRPDSMWDHALMEPNEALSAVNNRLFSSSSSARGRQRTTTAGQNKVFSPSNCTPWMWDAGHYQRPDPIPSTLLEIAHFSAPASPASAAGHADFVCGMEFEEHGWLLATAGVSKQVRVYSLASFLENNNRMVDNNKQIPSRVHRLASKLSSLAWNPDQPGVVTVGDYDGGIVQLDLESGHLVAEQDSGGRIWSVSHSHTRSHLAASASDDGTAVLWAGAGLRQAAARITPNSITSVPLTGVQLSPFDENLLAVASADSNAYVYDLRNVSTPLWTLQGHNRPVSYVKFLDSATVVTAGIDSAVVKWSLGAGAVLNGAAQNSNVLNTPARVFRGHSNYKNFVGLAVRPEDQLVACGSENSRVYTYAMAWDAPVASFEFDHNSDLFCSAVAWQPAGAAPSCGPLLAAASSDGDVKILALRKDNN